MQGTQLGSLLGLIIPLQRKFFNCGEGLGRYLGERPAILPTLFNVLIARTNSRQGKVGMRHDAQSAMEPERVNYKPC